MACHGREGTLFESLGHTTCVELNRVAAFASVENVSTREVSTTPLEQIFVKECDIEHFF
jgi:hypothetical protein